jgi:hypothetical protein
MFCQIYTRRIKVTGTIIFLSVSAVVFLICLLGMHMKIKQLNSSAHFSSHLKNYLDKYLLSDFISILRKQIMENFWKMEKEFGGTYSNNYIYQIPPNLLDVEVIWWDLFHSILKGNRPGINPQDIINRVQLLLLKGIKINVADAENHQTAAHISAKYGYASVLSLLVMSGANLTIKDKEGKTPEDLLLVYGIKFTTQAEDTSAYIKDIPDKKFSSIECISILTTDPALENFTPFLDENSNDKAGKE